MNASSKSPDSERYARCISASKRVRWDIDEDVIRGRSFDRSQKYLPDGLSLVPEFATLSGDEKRFVSQIQGRTYANMFGLVERFINAKVLEISHDHWLGDQVALEALVRFSDEELKHQELFRRINDMVGETLPTGYYFDVDPNAVAGAVRQVRATTAAVLALGAVAVLMPVQEATGQVPVALWFALPLALNVSCLAIARFEIHPYPRWASPAGQRLLSGLQGRGGSDLTAVAVRGPGALADPDLRAAFAHRDTAQRGH